MMELAAFVEQLQPRPKKTSGRLRCRAALGYTEPGLIRGAKTEIPG